MLKFIIFVLYFQEITALKDQITDMKSNIIEANTQAA